MENEKAISSVKPLINIPKVPAPIAQFLLRVPISILFLQQGFSKLPVAETVAGFGLPYIVWWFVAYGEIGSAIGLIIGGLLGFKYLIGLGDLITRFSGITMTCIMTGVIWVTASPDLQSMNGFFQSIKMVLLYDYLHVSLYFAGLYFALAGNAKWNS
jgi:uncharacterized membrane protein YphA (DoxX/SURF4 family)|tara:strand:+ start:150 stop:620 length:471 start_codon:yes stop_codon:yes gene_type:complete